jgi:hypothetical protein
MYKIFLFSLILLLSACGYKPTLSITKQTLKGNVYIDTPINKDNIKNSILIRESLITMFSGKFKMNVVNDKKKADLIVIGQLVSISHSALESNLGYAKLYRQSVSITINYSGKNIKSKSISASDYYDYYVDDDSVLSEDKKDNATKMAIQNALLSIPSQIALSIM